MAVARDRSTAAPPPGQRGALRCMWGNRRGGGIKDVKQSQTVWQQGHTPAHKQGARGNRQRVFICYRCRVGTACQDSPPPGGNSHQERRFGKHQSGRRRPRPLPSPPPSSPRTHTHPPTQTHTLSGTPPSIHPSILLPCLRNQQTESMKSV